MNTKARLVSILGEASEIPVRYFIAISKEEPPIVMTNIYLPDKSVKYIEFKLRDVLKTTHIPGFGFDKNLDIEAIYDILERDPSMLVLDPVFEVGLHRSVKKALVERRIFEEDELLVTYVSEEEFIAEMDRRNGTKTL